MIRTFRTSSSVFSAAFAILLALFLGTPARTQVVGGSISGTVADPSGAVITNASVLIHNDDTSAQRSLTTSGASATFTAPSLAVGSYTITANAPGFAPYKQTGVEITVGQSLELTLKLAVTGSDSITVEAVASTVNISTDQTAGLVDSRQVKELPLNGRSYDQLITLNPGTVNYTNQRSGGVGSSNSSVGSMFSASGRRPQDNLFLLNGIEYTGASLINTTPGGTSGQLLGIDGIHEFNVVTDTYSAAYGKRDGAQISIVTTSGTNKLHGTAYEFLRNSFFDARNYFDGPRIPEFQRNDFGGSLGGPIKKDKVFLFGNYEGYRQNLGVSIVTLVPDATSRSKAVVAVQPLLNLWPVANGPEVLQNGAATGIATYTGTAPQHIREDFGTTRLDYNPTAKDSFYSTYTIDDSDASTPSANPYSYVSERLREQVLSGQEQHIFSTSVINIARIGFSRSNFYFYGYVPAAQQALTPSVRAGVPTYAVVISGSTASNGASSITGAGANVGSNNGIARNLYTFDDHIYYTVGKHTIQGGVWLQRLQSNDNLAQDQYGQASFASLTTFLAGTVKTFTYAPSTTELGWRTLFADAFLEDTWHITPNFELRAGFRSESSTGWSESQNRASVYTFANEGNLHQSHQRSVQRSHQQPRSFPARAASWLRLERLRKWAYQRHRRGSLPSHAAGRPRLPHRPGRPLQHRVFLQRHYRRQPHQRHWPCFAFHRGYLHIYTGANLLHPPCRTEDRPSHLSRHRLQRLPQLSPDPQWRPERALLHHRQRRRLLPRIWHSCQPRSTHQSQPSRCQHHLVVVRRVLGNYNALVVDLRHDLSHGLQLRANYTWSRSLDDGSAWNTSVSSNTPAFVEVPQLPHLDYGPAATNIPNAAAINATYELPFGAGKAFLANGGQLSSHLVSGWTLASIVNISAGFPFSPQLGYNPTGSGDSRNPVRPNLNPAFSGQLYPGGATSKRVTQYFNPNAFSAPAAGYVGNAPRDGLTGPGFADWDLSLLKSTDINERARLQFRAEFFNVLNHTNLQLPNEVVYSTGPTQGTLANQSTAPVLGSPGVISATANTSRQIQLGLKLLF